MPSYRKAIAQLIKAANEIDELGYPQIADTITQIAERVHSLPLSKETSELDFNNIGSTDNRAQKESLSDYSDSIDAFQKRLSDLLEQSKSLEEFKVRAYDIAYNEFPDLKSISKDIIDDMATDFFKKNPSQLPEYIKEKVFKPDIKEFKSELENAGIKVMEKQ